MTVYQKIDKVLKQHENYKYCERTLESIADYLDWAWKWRKITEAEKDELVDRWLVIYESECNLKYDIKNK